jgi:hypothetical protein
LQEVFLRKLDSLILSDNLVKNVLVFEERSCVVEGVSRWTEMTADFIQVLIQGPLLLQDLVAEAGTA